MLRIQDIVYRAAGRPLLDRASLSVNDGERVGLVGRNGSGKTTLLRLIAGELQPDGGEIALTGRRRVGRVAQEAPGGPESLIETVLAADRERGALLAEAEHCREPQRIAEIHERLATIRADSAPARAARVLAGLGFDEAAQQGPCRALSGGWRMRVALAALLFAEPDVLLLDEPTNHLDLEATLWLEGFLRNYRGMLILVSHDRDLLNKVAEKIAHLESGKLTLYAGNYDRFERTRREHLERQSALQARQQEQRRRIQAFVDRFRYKASKARQAQSRLKALARMEPIAAVVESRTTSFAFPTPDNLAPPLLSADGVAVGYGDGPTVLSNLGFRLDPEDRVALLGANGNGKSTLIRLIAGRLAPRTGRLTRARKLKVGYFAQDQAEELDLAATPLLLMARALPKANETVLRAQLGRFGFGADHAELRVAKLSGGEKARLLFALATRDAPQMLLLDEPTNHLDVDAREALVQAINDFAGAVVLVSHDPHLIELTADRLWLVADGGVTPFDGDLDDYRRVVLERGRAARRQSRTAAGGNGESRRKERRKAGAEARAAVAHLRRAARDAEARLAKLSAERSRIETRLGDAAIYDRPGDEVQALQIRFAELEQEIGAAEEAWLEAQSKIEAATQARDAD